MSRPTTIKEALSRWSTENEGKDPTQAKDIQLQFQWPPVEKMDGTLSTLVECEKLSLSSNMIDKVIGLSGMKNLRVLSLARNYIKSLNGIESVGETLEELWVSYNLIDKLKGVESLKRLKVLYIGNNSIREWGEFNKLQAVTTLEDLLFAGNPLVESIDEAAYVREVQKRLPTLRKLDGENMLTEED
ncbi:dynein light chain 1 [Culex quinquefasciatus]|uniref:Dynein axonemal light chain 1 n=2 Tax=Culex pipiens complex TaxID=518105 RepID=B0WWM7_CULQU|nr:dynein axonemal light chain 1 [Culex pipiens pallens]EDS36119.1 dynein light chain 1 [Culex quinquefasciatus]|eukprot:XP_001861799.1 dynein light chain 1 [Culex quinquefasciatus]